jgi:membrane protease YdiL (CAAX protease family)
MSPKISASVRGGAITVSGLLWGIVHMRKLAPTMPITMAAVMAMPFLLAKSTNVAFLGSLIKG